MTNSSHAEYLLAVYDITSDELEKIRVFGISVIPGLETYIAAFYTWLETQPEFDQFFSNRDNVPRVQRLQQLYWQEFFQAQVD